MIQALGATNEELAAIVAALTTSGAERAQDALVRRPLAWALAARYPDAEFDELRAIVCSTRS